MEETKKNYEIDIIQLGLTMIKDWKRLLCFIIVAGCIGVIIAFNTPKVYTSSAVLAPELGAGGVGLNDNLADMASNFGIDLGSKNKLDAIYPEIYPEIFASTDFIIQLFNVKVTTQKDNLTKTYKEHLLKDTKVSFWQYPQIWLQKILEKKSPSTTFPTKANPLIISKDAAVLCERIKKNITCLVDKKTSIICINVQDQDPMVAAILADTLEKKLQTYITNYRTKKAKADYEYYKNLTIKSKERYIKAQRLYAGFSDSNIDPELEAFSVKRDQLENEMQLRYNVYTQMSTQMQHALAKIQERTPAFTILEHPRMPYRSSSRPRSVTIIIFMILGFICNAILHIYQTIKNKK